MPTRIRFEQQEIPSEKIKKLKLFAEDGLITSNFDKNNLYKSQNTKSQILPVLYRGKLQLFSWKGFCRIEFLKAGKFKNLKPKLVKVLVCQAYTKGIWYQIKEGIHGILIWESVGISEQNKFPACYLLTEPATHYFKTMTGADRMPVLINQKI